MNEELYKALAIFQGESDAVTCGTTTSTRATLTTFFSSATGTPSSTRVPGGISDQSSICSPE